jgi:hypothetical protein
MATCNTASMIISRIFPLIASVVLLAALTGCAAETEEPTVAPEPPATEPVTPEEVEPPADCIAVSQSTIDAINTGVAAISSGNSIIEAYAVKAGERENVYFIAADITGEGISPGDAQALWATNGDVTADAHSGVIFSINSFATTFSDWADGAQSDAALSSSEEGAQEALDCIPE